RIAINTGLFVLGFTVVFVALFLTTWSVSDVVFRNQETLTRVSGALVLLMALYLAGSQLLTTPRLYQEFRFHPHLERFGPVAAPIAGAAFGLGWTPCIGPILGAVLGFAARGENLARSTLLLVAYSLGLGVSFLAVGLALADAGYDVVVSARTVKEGDGASDATSVRQDRGAVVVPGSLERTAEEIEERGRRALIVPMDLLDRDAVLALPATVLREWGRIDVLFNNAIYKGVGTLDRV